MRQIRGEECYSIPEAAQALRVNRVDLWRWVKKARHPGGQELRAYRDALTGHYFIAADSVRRLQELYGEEDSRFRPVNPSE